MSRIKSAVSENRQAIERLKAKVAYIKAEKRLKEFGEKHCKEIEALERSRDRGYDEVRERAVIRLEEIRVEEIALLREVRLCGRNLIKFGKKKPYLN